MTKPIVGLITALAACVGTQGAADPVAGCYVFGHEVNVFKPAGTDSAFWVTGSQDVLQQLRTTHDSLTSRPYEAIFARVIAQPSSRTPDGFAQDYDGLLEVRRVVELRRAVPGECP